MRGFMLYGLAGLTAALAAMVVSFVAVRAYLAGTPALDTPSPMTIAEANWLQANHNDATGLMYAYLEHVPFDVGTPDGNAMAWISQEFLPRIQDLRSALSSPRVPASDARAGLVDAVERMFSMAKHPEDANLRRQAADQLSSASAAVEHYILGLDVGGFLHEAHSPFVNGEIP